MNVCALSKGLRKSLLTLLAVLLAIPALAWPQAAGADIPYDDSQWRGYPGYDVVLGGVWSRQQVADYMWRFDDRGFDQNFAWYSNDTVIQSGSWDQRVWSSLGKDNAYSWYSQGYWWTPLKTIFYRAPATFRAYEYGGSFIAKVCGNSSWSASNPQPPRISGYKWNDLDGDSSWDSGEPAMNGWKINFYRYGSYMGSATTNQSGYYEFVLDANAGRLPGTWTMAEELKPNWYQTKAPSSVQVHEGPYSAGRNYGGHDFGNARYGTVSGVKWNDIDADGVRDTGEPGLGGWVIKLRGPVNKDAETSANGAFAFNDLPVGTYTVREVQQNGWRQTAPAQGTYTVAVTSGGGYPDKNFGNVQDGSITPYKVHDADMSGDWSEGDSILANWVMHLGNDIRTPLTTSNSVLTTPKWERLPADTYTVWEEPQPHFAATGEPTQTVVLGPGQHITVPFFNVALGRIDVVKYHDLDGDGSRVDEPAVEGWEITLSKDGDAVATAATDADGAAAFEDLLPGTYTVTEESRPPYWVSTTSDSREIILGPGQDVDVFFGNRLLGDIEGYKYEDTNGNSTHDSGEPPVAGVEVALSDASGATVGLPATTDADGKYRFAGVVPGEYVVTETVPEGWMASSAASCSVTVVGGRVNDGPDFMNVEGVSISGAKYDDSNADGSRSADETGLAGWEIVLERKTADGWSVEATMSTGADGSYGFDMLWPAEYRVREVLQPHWKQTDAPDPLGFLSSGDDRVRIDFGNIKLAQLTLYKWDDSNSNAMWDDGEMPIPGWEFEITGSGIDGSSFSRETVATGADGSILLEDLMPGEYSAAEQHIGRQLNPDGTVAEPGWRATTSDSATVMLAEGDAKSTSFGNIHLGWLWGRVTHEVYGYPVSGMKIDLEETGETSYTNSNGYYFFYDVEPNETSACPTADYLVGMDLSGTDWKTRGPVDQSVVVPEGGSDRADFTVYEDTYGNQPRTIGYWKNWKNHYSYDQMQVLVDKVRAGSDEFANLTVADVYTILQIDKKSSVRDKARTQYLAFWLNVASGNLGFSTTVNVSSVSGWQQVATSAASDGLTTVIDLIFDAEAAFKQTWVPAVWETIKNIFDQMNNGQLT